MPFGGLRPVAHCWLHKGLGRRGQGALHVQGQAVDQLRGRPERHYQGTVTTVSIVPSNCPVAILADSSVFAVKLLSDQIVLQAVVVVPQMKTRQERSFKAFVAVSRIRDSRLL